MTNNNEAYLKDLELQWQDHFHMRDQTWKTITNSSLILIGLVGMDLTKIDSFIIVVTSLVLLLNSVFGYAVAVHHRFRQKEKFEYIDRYEELLGLKATGVKGKIMKKYRNIQFKWYDPRRLANNINTADFIKWMHVLIFFISLLFLGKWIRKL